MFIVETTTYCFDPVREYKAMRDFECQIDMKEWQKSESTASVSYTHVKRTAVTLPEVPCLNH